MIKTLLFLMISSVSAATFEVSRESYDFSKVPEYQAIMSQLKPFGEFSSKKLAPATKAMSRGEAAVEAAKARNRAILAQSSSTPKKEGLEAWKDEVKSTHQAWKQEIEEQRQIWKREQEIFLGRLKEYRENTFEIPVKKEVIIEQEVSTEILPDVHIVNAAFAVPIRDQRARATCSAFAGIRALETILAQHKMERDLSEQYFYWASKPTCQTSPCAEKGSWVNYGLQHSQRQSQVDVPLEETCNYQFAYKDKNETQTPLPQQCRQGSAKVVSFEDVRTLADVVEKIKQDIPVIMAAKLSENFYKNQGLIRLSESQGSGVKLDAHAKGHAFLAVGVIELPQKLREQEGNFCLVIANSWGKGWGAGGYSCLSEKWLTKFRQPGAFVAVTKVETR